jgi:hypothetical protein
MPGSCTTKADCKGLDDACHVGNCLNGTCEQTPANDGSACDDGMYCTENDACQSGTCVGGTQKFCPSPDACHVASCDEATKACGITAGNDGVACDDGDPCTFSGTCAEGGCIKGPSVDCSAFDSVCGTGMCDPVLGCKAIAKNEGSPCDDGLYCTVQDVCTAGVCSGVPNTCVAPGDICLIGSCDEANDSCVAVPANEAAVCDDKNACTMGEACSSGTCTNGLSTNEGGTCDDGKACTANDTCASGVCAGTPILACANGDGCCPAGCTNAVDDDCKCNVNLALAAKASTSGGGSAQGYDPPVMNDGVGKSCNGWCWIDNGDVANGAWAELDWPQPVTIGSMYVETEDNDNPLCGNQGRNIASATIQYWNGGAWMEIMKVSSLHADVKVDFPMAVTTTKLRMYDMTTDPGNGNSIVWEWHVYQGTGCVPPP